MMRLGVAAALVDGVYQPGDVEIDNEGCVSAVGVPAPGTGLAVPDLVDLQANGFAGVDFLTADIEDYSRAGAALARTGVLAYQPTLITSLPEQTIAALTTAAKAQTADGGARILGVHLEGPFLSPQRPGTHPVPLLRTPDTALLRRLLAAGPVTQLTLAPELPNALDLIEACVRAGTLGGSMRWWWGSLSGRSAVTSCCSWHPSCHCCGCWACTPGGRCSGHGSG